MVAKGKSMSAATLPSAEAFTPEMPSTSVRKAVAKVASKAEPKTSGKKSTVLSAAAQAARVRAAVLQADFDFGIPGELRCGVDEAGRGPLAGPVVAAAVILDPARPIIGLNDSKVLSAKVREALYEQIIERAMAFSIAEASVAEIDEINILHATMLAMRRAVVGLSIMPELALIDGNRCPTLPIRTEAVIGGDALIDSISAASILAKVTRDRLLHDLHEQHPEYGFSAHMGYGTPQHLAALMTHGPCGHHRRSFAPVREAWSRLGQPLPGAPLVASVASIARTLAASGASTLAIGGASELNEQA